MMTQRELLQCQQELKELFKRDQSLQASIAKYQAKNDPLKVQDAQERRKEIATRVSQIRYNIYHSLKPIAEEINQATTYDKETPLKDGLDELYETAKYRTQLSQIQTNITNNSPSTATELQQLFKRTILKNAIEALEETAKGLAKKTQLPTDYFGRVKKTHFALRVTYINSQIERLQAIHDAIDDAQPAIKQAFQNQNLGKQAKELGYELAHSQLLCTPTQPTDDEINNKTPPKKWAEILTEAFKKFDTDPDTRPTQANSLQTDLENISAIVNTLADRAPWDGSTESYYIAGSDEISQDIGGLAQNVPQLDYLRDTHSGMKGIAIDKRLTAKFNELKNILENVRNLAATVDNLSHDFRNPTISSSEKEEKITQFHTAVTDLKDMGDTLNAFLFEHATSRSDFLGNMGHGSSDLSDITQNKLNELVGFNDRLINQLKLKLSTEMGFDPHTFKATKTIFDWPVTIVRSLYHNLGRNRAALTRPGSAATLRNNNLISDPGYALFYGGETRVQVFQNHIFGKPTLVVKSELANITLPIHGPRLPNEATTKQVEESRDLSVLAACKEAFGIRWHDHVTFKNGGKSVYVEWLNKKEKEAFFKALKSRDEKYKKLQTAIKKGPEIKATMDQGDQADQAENKNDDAAESNPDITAAIDQGVEHVEDNNARTGAGGRRPSWTSISPPLLDSGLPYDEPVFGHATTATTDDEARATPPLSDYQTVAGAAPPFTLRSTRQNAIPQDPSQQNSTGVDSNDAYNFLGEDGSGFAPYPRGSDDDTTLTPGDTGESPNMTPQRSSP